MLDFREEASGLQLSEILVAGVGPACGLETMWVASRIQVPFCYLDTRCRTINQNPHNFENDPCVCAAQVKSGTVQLLRLNLVRPLQWGLGFRAPLH